MERAIYGERVIYGTACHSGLAALSPSPGGGALGRDSMASATALQRLPITIDGHFLLLEFEPGDELSELEEVGERGPPRDRLEDAVVGRVPRLSQHERRREAVHVPFFFQHLGACRRRTPRTLVDVKVPKDASHQDLSNVTPLTRSNPSAFAVGMRRKVAKNKSGYPFVACRSVGSVSITPPTRMLPLW